MLIEMMNAEEARVLGTLAEKSLATPDYYPMTLNALRNACNQKSNRDPVTEYDDETLLQALNGLKRKCLVTFIPYGSQPNHYKYRHFLEDPRFNLHKRDIAVLAVLLLRGAQTLNEVKLRASSLHPLESLEETESVLTDLSARPEPLTERLAKRPGWKEPRWRDLVHEHPQQGAHSEQEGAHGSAHEPAHGATQGEVVGAMDSDRAASPTSSVVISRASGFSAGANLVGAAISSALSQSDRSQREEIDDLKKEVADLKTELAAVKAIVEKIKSELY